jgi:hypothetical protein
MRESYLTNLKLHYTNNSLISVPEMSQPLAGGKKFCASKNLESLGIMVAPK